MLEESATRTPSIWATINSWFTPSVFFVLLNLMIGTIFITSSLSTHKPKEEEQEPHHDQQQQQHEESPKPLQFTRSPSMLQRLKSISLYCYRSQEPNTHFGKTPEMETHYGFLQQGPELGHEQERESEKEAPFLTRSPSMLDRLKSFNLYKYVSPDAGFSPTHHSSEQPHEPEQQRAQAEEEGQVDPARDEEAEEQEEQELEDVEEEEEEDEDEDEQSLDDVYSQLKENHAQRTKSDTKPASGELTPKLPRKMRKSASLKSAFAHFEEDDIVEARRPATTREGKGKASHEVDEEVDAKADDFINRFKQQLKLQRLDSFMRYKEMINRGNGK
ncbi:pathogen-associated molecular patterns-induced protein A70-like [Rhodamnia argentea]|uniref:Pathogen-associated molecular patterns-induced protein A70-like n=1 Tax=Rhodamnia argentea TaxID=178133 RepID=A0A8B8P783_9MYRT|nr:pathogen-associated molecular patterns-induced protein A70-like [Rhodamnia argentea]